VPKDNISQCITTLHERLAISLIEKRAMGDKLMWKHEELAADDYKETSSIQRKAIKIEAAFNLKSDGGVGKASLIISNLLLKKHLEAVKVRVLEAISSDYKRIDN
jgi:hypothetical protein